jgi:hypothetical protein
MQVEGEAGLERFFAIGWIPVCPLCFMERYPRTGMKSVWDRSCRMRIRGFPPNAEAIRRFVAAGGFIDVAYVDKADANEILLVADIDIDFDKAEDFEWVKSTVEQYFARYWIRNLQFDVVHVQDA